MTGSDATGSASATDDEAASAGGAGGRMVLINRGGGNDGAAGLAGATGAAPFFTGAPPFFTGLTADSEKMSPLGSSIPRWRASRSTN
jgi:hypothetical protein